MENNDNDLHKNETTLEKEDLERDMVWENYRDHECNVLMSIDEVNNNKINDPTPIEMTLDEKNKFQEEFNKFIQLHGYVLQSTQENPQPTYSIRFDFFNDFNDNNNQIVLFLNELTPLSFEEQDSKLKNSCTFLRQFGIFRVSFLRTILTKEAKEKPARLGFIFQFHEEYKTNWLNKYRARILN